MQVSEVFATRLAIITAALGIAAPYLPKPGERDLPKQPSRVSLRHWHSAPANGRAGVQLVPGVASDESKIDHERQRALSDSEVQDLIDEGKLKDNGFLRMRQELKEKRASERTDVDIEVPWSESEWKQFWYGGDQKSLPTSI